MVDAGYAFFVLFHAVGVALGTKTRPIKNCEMGGAPVCGGRRLMGENGNQPNDSVHGGGAFESRCDRAGTCGKDVNPLFGAAN